MHIPLSDALEKVDLVHTTDKKCGKTGFKFMRQFNRKEIESFTYSGKMDEKDLTEWAKSLMVADVFEFTDDDVEIVFHEEKDIMFLFRSDKD